MDWDGEEGAFRGDDDDDDDVVGAQTAHDSGVVMSGASLLPHFQTISSQPAHPFPPPRAEISTPGMRFKAVHIPDGRMVAMALAVESEPAS